MSTTYEFRRADLDVRSTAHPRFVLEDDAEIVSLEEIHRGVPGNEHVVVLVKLPETKERPTPRTRSLVDTDDPGSGWITKDL